MKKKLGKLFLVLGLFLGISFFSNDKVSADTIDSLPEEARQHFISEGFSMTDEVFVESNVQQSELRAVNVVTIAAATKRVSTTMGYTSYYITSGKPILSTNTVVNYGGYNSKSSVNVYGKPVSYSGGIYYSYTGKSKYFSCSVTSQVTTTLGPTSVSSKAGGLTLGN